MSKRSLLLIVTVAALLATGCSRNKPPAAKPDAVKTNSIPTTPSALPHEGFKAQVTIVSPPAKLRAGEKVVVQIKIKNASNVQWWARGAPVNTSSSNKFYIAAGDRWLKADGSVLTDMDGRYGISKDLKPGEEEEVPLLITAPTTAGDYTLEVDVVQEGVTWFSEQGSPTAKTRITVAK
jgi:hypothetical protein